jgi:acyl-CoA reductase-like NAD-dependent aldehyde dehydrogenase
MNERQIDKIVERVVERLERDLKPGAAPTARPTTSSRREGHAGHGIFSTVDDAVAAAERAFEELRDVPLEGRKRMVDAMRETMMAHRDELSRMAVDETGLGRVSDKLGKNELAAMKTPGPEILEPKAWSGDDGLTLLERAPYGIIGAITPCTNASETIINNGIGMFSGGNTVVFNVHPAARGVCNYTVSLLNDAIVKEGGPSNCLCSIDQPTIESANGVMKHPKIRLVTVTGGGGVVKAAMNSGKRAIAAGPGNPPCVVDETADIRQAAEGIIAGASIDNNIVCIAEKELIAVEDIADILKRELLSRQVVEVSGRDLKKLEKQIITPDDHVNRDYIGKNPSVILGDIGIQVSDEVRLVLAEVDESHPFVQHELLMPVLGMVRVPDVDEAIDMAYRVEHNFFHTSVMYSRNIEKMHKMARKTNTSIFVKNAPSVAGIGGGGEGYTSWTIASPTGEGLTTAISFTRERRCTLKEYFRIV